MAVRGAHEMQEWDAACFITLTYNDAHLPWGGTLVRQDLQRFMKRLRKVTGNGLRFLACGEYGDDFLRPHYHAVLFNYDFPDREFLFEKNGKPHFTSETLNRLWSEKGEPIGHALVCAASYETVGYVCRYVLKKITGEKAESHYLRPDPRDDTMYEVLPEFSLMSRRPGIGAGWLKRYAEDAYPDDFIVLDGKKVGKPPRYYDNLMTEIDPELVERVKRARKRKAREHADNNTPERLAVREELQHRRAERLVRPLEQQQ